MAMLSATGCSIPNRTAPEQLPLLVNGKTKIYAANGDLIVELQSEERRESVKLSEIPKVMQNAIVSIEDERFWSHNGVDPKATLRAVRSNTGGSGISQGGSTITQQYIKNVFLTPSQTLKRKLEEATLALELEKHFSKEVILEQYLNTIYFGNRANGIQVASQTYFGKPIQQIALPEAALLAGLVQSPTLMDPYKKPERATTRRNLVLKKMLELGYIDQQAHDAAVGAPLILAPLAAAAPAQRYAAPHFVEEVKKFIRTDLRFGKTAAEREDLLLNGALNIYTTIDLRQQQIAEDTIRAKFPRQNRKTTDGSKDPDVGLVAIESHTGFVRAMVGGYDYFDDNPEVHPYAQVNLAVGRGRQAGSTMKAIGLAAAMNSGLTMSSTFPSPASTVIRYPGKDPWAVKGHALGDKATLTECIVQSANVCFANLIADKRIGPQKVLETAFQMGIDVTKWLGTVGDPALSEILGSKNTTVLDVAEAYSVFANRGLHVPATMVTKVVKSDGTVIFQQQHAQNKVIEPEASDSITTAMEGVLTQGTAKNIGSIGRPAAGKTGTTQDETDALFVGYTPELTTAVWTGYADPYPPGNSNCPREQRDTGCLRQVGDVGAQIAAPVWRDFTKAVLADVAPTPWDFTYQPVPVQTTVPKQNIDVFEPALGPTYVEMPMLTGFNIDDAASKARKSGLELTRVVVPTDPSVLPGQVVTQAPAPGSQVVKGSRVTIETSAGDPPASGPIEDLRGQRRDAVVPVLQQRGYTVLIITEVPPAGFLLPSGRPPNSGEIWDQAPTPGQPSKDGRISIRVQP